MSKLENLATFAEVARAGSFSAAAKQLELPRSTVSFRIASLERALNLRLLKRSTRSVALTQEGHELYQASAKLLHELQEALDRAGHPLDVLRGIVRLAMPSDLPQGPLTDAIVSFRRIHPDISFDIRFTNEVLDLVKENIDFAVRLGVEGGADVVRRKVLDITCGFFAHRDWIAMNSVPADISEAKDLFYPVKRSWIALKELRDAQALPPPAINVNSFAMIKSMVLKASGIGYLPKAMMEAEVGLGEAQEVLGAVSLPPLQMHLSFATRADITPRVKAFAHHLASFM